MNKEQYYKMKPAFKAFSKSFHTDIMEPVDIGWRWCRDSLPKQKDDGTGFSEIVMVKTKHYVKCHGWYDHLEKCWQIVNDWEIEGDEPVQWCKLPEPLTEDGDE